MQNYTSNNRLSQKFGVKDYSDNRTSVEVIGRVGVNTNEAVQALDVRGSAYVSSNVGIGQTTFDFVDPTNTSRLAVGVVTAVEFIGDGSKLKNITNVAFANSLNKTNAAGQLLYQQGNQITSLLEFGQTGQVLSSQGDNKKPVWASAAPAGAVEGFLIRDEGVQVGFGTTFSGLNFVGAAVVVDGTELGGFATVTVNQNFAKVAGFASDSGVAGVASDAQRVRLSDLSDDVQVFIPFSTEAAGVTTINTNQNLTFNPSSGLLTATRFSGIGSDITDLNASNLEFGTLPDEVFPNPLPAVSGKNLTELPADVGVGFANTAGIATEAVTAGIATTAINVKVEAETTDTTCFITFATQQNSPAGKGLPLKTNSTLKFNANDGTLAATKFSGDGSGLTDLVVGTIGFAQTAGVSTTADGLTTARTLWGQSFNGGSNISGALSDVGNITGSLSNLTIQPKDDTDDSYDLILRGNDNASNGGGGVHIGDIGRGAISFKTKIDNGYRFYKENNGDVFGSFDFTQLQGNQTYTFQNDSGTLAFLDDITNGTADQTNNLKVDAKTDDVDYQLTFINPNATGIFTTFFSNNQITYNPQKDVLTVGDFVGVGSRLTNLDAGNIDRGILNTNRLPATIRKTEKITIDAEGENIDLDLQAGRTIRLQSGIEDTQGGGIVFIGKNGDESYGFAKSDDNTKKAFVSAENLSADEIYDFPNKAGAGGTFALLEDITQGTAGTAEKIEVQTRNNNDVDYTIIFSQGAGDSQSIFNSGSNFTYNASTDTLKAPKFSGIGSDLTDLDADELSTGTVPTARLPRRIVKNEDIEIIAQQDGDDNTYNLTIESSNNTTIRAGVPRNNGPAAAGTVFFRADNGILSYGFRRLKDGVGSKSRNVYLSFDDVEGTNTGVGPEGDGTVFKLPNRSGVANTFAMLDDITGSGGSGVVAGSAAKLENAVTLNFTEDVTGSATFDGSISPIGVAITVTGGDVDFATTAGVSTLAQIVDGSDDSDPAVYLTFVDDTGAGNRALKTDSALVYDQANDELVTNLKGTADNATNATNAENVKIIGITGDDAVEGNNGVIFGTGGSTGNNQKLRKDTLFSYHTPSKILFVPNISASGFITATNIAASGIITATDFNSTSDIKLKTNIERISDPIEKVLQIDGVSFNWIGNGKPSLGVIADNVQEVLPELVSDGDPKTVNYNGLIGLLIEAVKEQQSEINSLKERLSKLE